MPKRSSTRRRRPSPICASVWFRAHRSKAAAALATKNGQWKGRFDLRARALNLNVFARALRKTQLSGPITIAAHKGAQRITAELADAQAALRAQMKITL